MFGVPHGFHFFVFFKSVGIGFLIGLIYTLFSALRQAGIRGKRHVAVQDILFFLIAAALSFLLLFDVNAGVMRAYILAGEGLGAYLCTLAPGGAATSAVRRIKRLAGRIADRIKRKEKKSRFAEKTVASEESDVI